MPLPGPEDDLTWITGMRTITTADDVNIQVGMAGHVYLVTRSMQCFSTTGRRAISRHGNISPWGRSRPRPPPPPSTPWIVTKAALDPFRVSTPPCERPLLACLGEPRPLNFDIELAVALTPLSGQETVISATNARELYCSAAQQLAHHASCGCPMRTGDLLGSGTIWGPERTNRGSLLELTWNGQEPLTLPDRQTRGFIEDGDRLTIRGYAQGAGYRIGFGDCSGEILRAVSLPSWGGEGHSDDIGEGI
ncbi:fumarylacetoacetate hydrolase family protein [Rhizobium sp. SYY.PMSO]|uniref:fumarylacetoacetate hydrolase family protein n=1 Tax=Rhizobium sp. SYY.PMSO TaxID=3382192 RepID=UPI003990389D